MRSPRPTGPRRLAPAMLAPHRSPRARSARSATSSRCSLEHYEVPETSPVKSSAGALAVEQNRSLPSERKSRARARRPTASMSRAKHGHRGVAEIAPGRRCALCLRATTPAAVPDHLFDLRTPPLIAMILPDTRLIGEEPGRHRGESPSGWRDALARWLVDDPRERVDHETRARDEECWIIARPPPSMKAVPGALRPDAVGDWLLCCASAVLRRLRLSKRADWPISALRLATAISFVPRVPICRLCPACRRVACPSFTLLSASWTGRSRCRDRTTPSPMRAADRLDHVDNGTSEPIARAIAKALPR